MEKVTKHNIRFDRKVKLTESGRELHKHTGLDLYEDEFYLAPDHINKKYYDNYSDSWRGLLNNIGDETFSYGIRIGEREFYDVYYSEPTYNIHDILTDLDKIEEKIYEEIKTKESR